MGKIIRDGNVISTYNYEKTVDQSDFINMITRPANITNIVVPEGVENIGDYAFYSWNNLKEVSLPNTLKHIGLQAFAYSNNMTLKDNKLPSSLRSLNYYAFSQCSKLVLFEFPENITVIPAECFRSCSSITNLNLTNITAIESNSFNGTKVTSVSFGTNLESIGSGAFANTPLYSITLPNLITIISSDTFRFCNALQKVVFNGNMAEIGSGAFFGCTSLSQFDLRNNTTVPTLNSVTSLGHASGCKIVIPNSLYDTWTTATNWTGLTDVQWIRVINSWDDTITAEGDYVLMSDLDLTDIRHLTPSANVKGA